MESFLHDDDFVFFFVFLSCKKIYLNIASFDVSLVMNDWRSVKRSKFRPFVKSSIAGHIP
jgi:hypothetical protein